VVGAVWGEAAAGLAAAYALAVEPFWIRGVTYVVDRPQWPSGLNGLTIVHLSDLHGRTTAFHRPWVQEWLAAADLIAVTGDLFSPTIPRRWIAETLAALPSDRTRWVSGNHDWRRGRLRVAPWDNAETLLLDNRWEERRYGADRYLVAGVPDLREGRPRWERFSDLPPDVPAVLLSHRPDAVLHPAARRFDLVLAGHTHGGQVAVPGLGPLLRHSALPRRRAAGRSEAGGQVLVVSRGLGTSHLPVRFWCRPEVVRIVVRAGSKAE
jgi:predicted MPP superfamily phosphohydrolase